jgi:putative FmdB family regulatory protein
MITYTYECKACGHCLQVQQGIKDTPLSDCPECERPALVRLITNGNFILKGSCWEADGYQ